MPVRQLQPHPVVGEVVATRPGPVQLRQEKLRAAKYDQSQFRSAFYQQRTGLGVIQAADTASVARADAAACTVL